MFFLQKVLGRKNSNFVCQFLSLRLGFGSELAKYCARIQQKISLFGSATLNIFQNFFFHKAFNYRHDGRGNQHVYSEVGQNSAQGTRPANFLLILLFGPGWNLYKLLSRLVVGSSVQPGGECDGKGPGADALMTFPIWRPIS